MLKKPQLEENAPWKQRFRVPHVAWVQLAQGNPARGIAVSTKSGHYQIYAWNLPANELRQLTFRPEGVPFGMLSPDGLYVYYLEDRRGNEIGHFVRVPFEGGEPQDITPERPPYSAFGISTSRAGNLLGATVSDNAGFHTVVLPVGRAGDIGRLKEIHHSRKIMFGPSLSHDGEIGVITSREHARFQHYSLIALDTKTGRPIAELREGEEAGLWPFGFSPLPGDFRFLAFSNRSGFNRPIVWNPTGGQPTELLLPQLPGDITPVDWSADGRHILLARSHQAIEHLAICDLVTASAGSGQAATLVPLDHPAGHYSLGAYSTTANEIFALWQDSTHPPQLIALDSRTGAKKRTVLPACDVPPGHPWRHITFISPDGETIQGWLGLPDGKGPFPTILHTHGGPETATVEYFLPYSQAWLDHGFAWLAINYRGSTGFGRAFREKSGVTPATGRSRIWRRPAAG